MSLASASTTLKLHDFPSGNLVHQYQPPHQSDSPIRSISWSKGGTWLALVPYAGFAEAVSTKGDSLRVIHTIQSIGDPTCATFQNTTKRNVAVGSASGKVFVYDCKSKSVRKEFGKGNLDAVTHVQWTSGDQHLVLAHRSGEAAVYSTVHSNLSCTFRVPKSQSISSLRTNPIKRNLLAAGSNEGVVAVWDINKTKCEFFVGSHKAPITAVEFSPVNANLVVSAGLDRQFCVYDVCSNRCIINMFVENSITALDFTPDGQYILMASQNGKIHVYDSKTLKLPVRSFEAHSSTIRHLSFQKSSEFDSIDAGLLDQSQKDEVDAKDQEGNFRNDSVTFDISLPSIDLNNSASQKQDVSQLSKDADSFLNALGLNNSVSISKSTSKVIEPSVPNTSGAKGKRSSTSTPGSRTGLPLTSNPLTPFTTNFSPIVSSMQSHDPSTQTVADPDVKSELVRISEEMKTFRQEVREELKKAEADRKYFSSHVIYENRQVCYHILSSMVKNFMEVDNKFEQLTEDLVNDLFSNLAKSPETLMNENFLLRATVAQLEQELAQLKSNNSNNKG